MCRIRFQLSFICWYRPPVPRAPFPSSSASLSLSTRTWNAIHSNCLVVCLFKCIDNLFIETLAQHTPFVQCLLWFNHLRTSNSFVIFVCSNFCCAICLFINEKQQQQSKNIKMCFSSAQKDFRCWFWLIRVAFMTFSQQLSRDLNMITPFFLFLHHCVLIIIFAFGFTWFWRWIIFCFLCVKFIADFCRIAHTFSYIIYFNGMYGWREKKRSGKRLSKNQRQKRHWLGQNQKPDEMKAYIQYSSHWHSNR